MGAKIIKIYPNSIAEAIGLDVGDELISINGDCIRDILDYKFMIQEYMIDLKVKKLDKIENYRIEKLPEQDLGIEFDGPIFDKIKKCHNSCIFCFIDQLPKGLRTSLYQKDDDYRLSFLYGNYITLTNLRKEDITKIIRYRLSPLYISVHSTVDNVRVKLMRNRKALSIIEKIAYLTENNISLNIQIVLIPDINDGWILEKTILDLYKFQKDIISVAIVPVGITRYRENLYPIRSFKKDEITMLISKIEEMQKRFRSEIGRNFVYLADEFYLSFDQDLPSIEEYDTLAQIEDGVGMSRLFIEEAKNYLNNIDICINENRIGFITGVLGAKVLKKIMPFIKKRFPHTEFIIIEVVNEFFGEKITVTGLLTAQDIINKLKKYKNKITKVFLPNIILNSDEKFLDDIEFREFRKRIEIPIEIIDISIASVLENVRCENKERGN